MKKYLLLLVLLVPSFLVAQTSPETDLTWGASTTVGVSYKIFRAPCTGTISGSTCSAAGTFVVVGQAAVATLAFADTTVTRGSLYDYYVTAICPTAGCPNGEAGESLPSNHWAGAIPKSIPGAATGLSGTVR